MYEFGWFLLKFFFNANTVWRRELLPASVDFVVHHVRQLLAEGCLYPNSCSACRALRGDEGLSAATSFWSFFVSPARVSLLSPPPPPDTDSQKSGAPNIRTIPSHYTDAFAEFVTPGAPLAEVLAHVALSYSL